MTCAPGLLSWAVWRRSRSGGYRWFPGGWQGRRNVLDPGGRTWAGSPEIGRQRGVSQPPFRGMEFSVSSPTLGTCTGIGTWTASVNGRGFVAEMGGNPPFQRGFCEHLDSSAGSGGRMHRPYWRGAFSVEPDGTAGAMAQAERCILHPWGCGGVGGLLAARAGSSAPAGRWAARVAAESGTAHWMLWTAAVGTGMWNRTLRTAMASRCGQDRSSRGPLRQGRARGWFRWRGVRR